MKPSFSLVPEFLVRVQINCGLVRNGNPPKKQREIEVEFSQLRNEGVLHEEITVFRQRDHGYIETG